MNKDDLLKVLGIIVLGAVAVYISRYIFLPSQDVVTLAPDGKYNGMSSCELLNSSSPVEIKITQEKRPDYLVETQFDLQDA